MKRYRMSVFGPRVDADGKWVLAADVPEKIAALEARVAAITKERDEWKQLAKARGRLLGAFGLAPSRLFPGGGCDGSA